MSRLDPDRLSRITQWMQSYVDDRRFPGCAALILEDGEERFFHAAGARDLETGTAWERDTVARIYSMTKPIASVAFMQLLERGLVHLDARLGDIIPAFANMHALVPGATGITEIEPAPSPTMVQCLTHTAGFSYPFNPGVLPAAMDEAKLMFAGASPSLTFETDRLGALPLAFQPGTRWEYSVGIDVIGRVVEVVSGQALDVYLQENVFAPLGMTDTSFILRDDQLGRTANLYTPLVGNAMDINAKPPEPGTLRLIDTPDESPFRTTTCWSGGGGLVGTIDDYARFTEALRTGGGPLLSPATTQFMMQNFLPGEIASMGPQSFAEQPMEGMGFGLGGAVVLDPARARTPGSLGDFSWGGMASTFFWIDRENALSVLFFTQLSPSSSTPARPQLKALVHGAMTAGTGQ
ncbi:MAG: serine hydrolase domain-containing protein [Pseudomonadota bacterium]